MIARGLKTRHMKVDNEASKLLKDYLCENKISFQLVPPYCHHRNAAERAIYDWEIHNVYLCRKTQQKLQTLFYCTLLGACTTHTFFGEPYLNGIYP
jgi:hypothetical protein